MFGRRSKPDRSTQQFHQADSGAQLFAQLLTETRADPEALFTIDVVDRGWPGRDLDERARQLRRTGVPRTPLAAPDPRGLSTLSGTASGFSPCSRPPFAAAAGDVFLVPDGAGGVLLGHVISNVPEQCRRRIRSWCSRRSPSSPD